MAGPDDEQVEAPTSLAGVTHNGGGSLRVTRSQKRGQKMHGSMHVSGTVAGKNHGRPEGVLVFKGGSSLPPARGRIHPSELARSRLAGRHREPRRR